MKHLLALVISATLLSLTTAEAKNVPLRYTRRLPSVDRVELQTLKSHEMLIESVQATKVMEGADARRIASLWRRQKYRSFSADCHYPAYGIKFYSRGKLLLYASVCWQCDNIAFIEPKGRYRPQGFDGTSRAGKELLELFEKSFR